MMDFKYHITTLTAIFLALALGLMIGINLSRQNAIQGISARAMQKLSAEFQKVMDDDQKIRAENAEFRQAAAIREQFESDLIPSLVSGRLQGKRVALIVTGEEGQAKYLHALTRAIDSAGGLVVSTTVMKDELLPTDPEARLSIMQRFGVQTTDPQSGLVELTSALCRAIVQGTAPRGLQRAADLSDGLILDGDYTGKVDAVALICCAERNRIRLVESGSSVEAGVLSTLKETQTRLVACEAEGPFSITSYLQHSGVTTVDSVDKAPGQIALVLALEGARGNFGLKPGAARVIPPLEVTNR